MTVTERFEQLKKKYHYDEAAADRVIRFLEKYCCHVEGDLYGQPLVLPQQYKDEIIRPVFGLKLPNGKRLIRYAFIQTPKKQAKTTMMAALELVMLLTDGEPGAQIYNCAGDDEQANLLFSAAKKMVQLSPKLSQLCKTYSGSITYGHSFIKKITSRSETKHGVNSHAVFYDELHVAKSSDLHENLKTSMAQRSNPIMFAISTPGSDKLSLCYQKYEYTKNLLSGTFEDDSFWGVIYESDPGDDIHDERTWRQANPLYDLSENLRRTIASESTQVRNDPSIENAFRRLRLGQWTSSETKWIKTELWTSLKSDISISDYQGDRVWLGCDLSASGDLTSLTSLYQDGEFVVPFWYLWSTEEAADQAEKRFGIPYSRWAQEGWISICEGNTIDFVAVENKIVDIHEQNAIQMLGYDEWNMRALAVRLQHYHDIPTVIQRQGYGLSHALRKIKELILAGKVVHNGNPVVAWAFDNILVQENNDNRIRIVKPRSTGGGSDRIEKKIDPWISFAMAVSEWMVATTPAESVYTNRGVITI